MDMAMVDVTALAREGTGVHVGDEVVLLGSQRGPDGVADIMKLHPGDFFVAERNAAPRQRCGPWPNARWSLGLRATSKRNGSGKRRSSTLADTW